jgi:small subunit ribosomal protein S13
MVFQTIRYRQATKKVRIALTKIFGIGTPLANNICDSVGISNQKINELSSAQIDRISSLITNRYFYGSELKKIIKADKQRLMKIGAFRSKKNIIIKNEYKPK